MVKIINQKRERSFHFSKQMAEALKAEGADVKFTLYPEANHNSWDPAFSEDELSPWLFSVKKKK